VPTPHRPLPHSSHSPDRTAVRDFEAAIPVHVMCASGVLPLASSSSNHALYAIGFHVRLSRMLSFACAYSTNVCAGCRDLMVVIHVPASMISCSVTCAVPECMLEVGKIVGSSGDLRAMQIGQEDIARLVVALDLVQESLGGGGDDYGGGGGVVHESDERRRRQTRPLGLRCVKLSG
jgi:hypothetical protein